MEPTPSTKREFEALIEYSSDIVSVLDDEGLVRYQSPSVERILGYGPEELVGDSVFEYVHPDDRGTVLALFESVVETGNATTERIEYRFRHADGSWVWLESVGRNHELDRLGGYVVNSREVTERKRRERELERQNERLDRFASVVGHDLRNPLMVLEGSLEMARESGDPDHFRRCERAVARMDQLIDDLLTLAREGKAVTDPEPVALEDVATDAWATVVTEEATLVVETDATVAADPGRLRQLLENLFHNAVEHAGPAVTVSVGSDGGGFYVADDGPGIDPEDRDDVFKFGHSTTRDGTGFGLGIVDEIADAHGWEVGLAESESGGTRVEVTGVGFVD